MKNTTIQKLSFVSQINTPDLYFKRFEDGKISYPNFIKDWAIRVDIAKDEIISTDTYFNNFYESFYVKHTKLKEVFLEVEYTGSIFVEVIRVSKGRRPALIAQQKCSSDEPSMAQFKVHLENEAGSRIFFNVTGLSKQSSLLSAAWYTDSPPNDIRLAIVMCTYKRETWVKKNVLNILESDDSGLPFEIIVVDNASELSLPPNPKLSLIQQANLGGAGGFGRGILEAFGNSRDFTHVLLMDDDIDIDPSVIHNLILLLRYVPVDHKACFGGAMLDRFSPERLYECGADTNKNVGKIQHIKATVADLDLREPGNLDAILLKKTSDYGAWWFFCFSKQAFEKVGMPMPCFIRGDDKEYGLRLKKNGYATHFPPNIGVWHEPFYAKNDGWLKYFDLYNALVTATLGRFYKSDLQNVISSIEQGVLGSIRIADYIACDMQLLAAEHFLKGVKYFYDSQDRLKIVRETASKYNLIIDIHDVNEYYKNNSKKSIYLKAKHKIKKIKRYKITHDASDIPSLLNQYQIVYLVNSYNNNVQVYRKDSILERKKIMRLKKALGEISRSWNRLMRDFQEAQKEFTTVDFWRSYTQCSTSTKTGKATH